jgi:hypothetical protein
VGGCSSQRVRRTRTHKLNLTPDGTRTTQAAGVEGGERGRSTWRSPSVPPPPSQSAAADARPAAGDGGPTRCSTWFELRGSNGVMGTCRDCDAATPGVLGAVSSINTPTAAKDDVASVEVPPTAALDSPRTTPRRLPRRVLTASGSSRLSSSSYGGYSPHQLGRLTHALDTGYRGEDTAIDPSAVGVRYRGQCPL